MNKLVIIIFLIVQFIGFGQEALEPLSTNFHLLNAKEINQRNTISNDDYIFLVDTINLPIIDDFSTDKFMKYVIDISVNNILDSNWYALYNLDGNLILDGSTYMTSPTYKDIYDSTQVNGVDTLVVISVENNPDTIIVYDLSTYPIEFDTLKVWPNITFIDSTWTVSDPDLSFLDVSPDLFQDSIRLFFVEPGGSDLNKLWLDQDVFLNDNYAINPWTIGVVTFDGIGPNGYPYDWSSPTAVDWADELTSKPIFLGQKNSSDSLYLSFYYQAGGTGENPDEDDSLVLEFYSPSTDQWSSEWSTNGFSSELWYFANIALTNEAYFQDGFQFRFRSYGSLTGSLDHWNLDYVLLDENRTINDTLMNDWAFTVPPNTVIKDYTAMPWSHYKQVSSSLIINDITVPTYNSSNSAKLLQPCAIDVIYKDETMESFPYAASVLNVPALSYFDMEYNFDSDFQFDNSIADTFVTFDVRFNISTNTTPERLSENDTIYHQQVFENYYAYDDGSAESAYGLVGNGVELAYRFTLPEGIEQDTLRALNIHFSPSVNDVSAEPFFIQVWGDDQGVPGDLIYTSDDFDLPELFYPQYNIGVNGFYNYEFPILVPVSGTYYVGWKQSSAERLNIGFDENINRQADIFYNMGSGFQNTIFEGALMMRPVFVSDMDGVVDLPVLEKSITELKVYPNPAQSYIYLENENLSSLRIYDLQGRCILQQNLAVNHVVNIVDLPNGVYLFDVSLNDKSLIRKKVIIQH